jgi:hypothetical protein
MVYTTSSSDLSHSLEDRPEQGCRLPFRYIYPGGTLDYIRLEIIIVHKSLQARVRVVQLPPTRDSCFTVSDAPYPTQRQ